MRYRVRVRSKDKRRWEARERREKNEDVGGCLKQTTADALWELSEKYDVGVWYEYKHVCRGCRDVTLDKCGVAINGIKLGLPYCRTVEDCVKQILEDYERTLEALREPPMRAGGRATEEFLRQYPELEVFGIQWVKEWLPHARERMEKIAAILRSHHKIREIIERIGLRENLYLIEIFISKDAAEECVAVGVDVYCLSDKIRKVSLDYIGLVAPRGLMAFAKRKEFVRAI
jgi:hypothetical protein